MSAIAKVEITGTDLASTDLKQALAVIAEKNEGRLAPEAVIEAAADPKSPLHEHFNWDDTEAARRWRLAQAGALIRRVKLTIVRRIAEESTVVLETTRQFQSRPSQRGAKGGYEPIVTIMSDEAKKAEMLTQALRELAGFRKRYEQLTELAELFEAMDPLIS